MSYLPRPFQHGQTQRVGVLIANLGTPEAPSAPALRRYLREFLSDPRVIEVPRLLWYVILHGVILRIRPARSARAYAGVWTADGSPLAKHTRDQAEALQQRLQAHYGNAVVLEWAMRYGQPSIASKLEALLAGGVDKLVVLPLYPQYSATTTASTFDAVANDFVKRRWLPELRFITGYHERPAYIQALVASIQAHEAKHGRPDRYVFSYHGLPMRYLHAGDPYHCYCLQTTRYVREQLDLSEAQAITTFQSRFGREPWLQPYTDHSLRRLAQEGVRSVAVICPGFAADCLETIEEIDEENRHYFLEAGGQEFHYIPALNAQSAHIDALFELCQENLDSWLPLPDSGGESVARHYAQCTHNRPKSTSSETTVAANETGAQAR